MEIEHVFCIYCKGIMNQKTEINYHPECKQMIQNYNKHLSIKIKTEIIEHKSIKNLKYGIYWLYSKYIAYKLIYAIGGINIVFIILYQVFIGF